jgi:uncharacterized protein YkwD
MKKILILLLFFTLSCKTGGNSSSSSESTNHELEGGDTNTQTPTRPTSPSPSNSNWTEDFMLLVNNHRAELGLRKLIHNDQVGLIAQMHSQNMAKGTVAFGHDGFSSRCSEARAELGGGNWCGENVAAGQKTPQAAFTSWMNSPGHRSNIESARATHTGFGYAKTSSGKLYWTQLFLQY